LPFTGDDSGQNRKHGKYAGSKGEQQANTKESAQNQPEIATGEQALYFVGFRFKQWCIVCLEQFGCSIGSGSSGCLNISTDRAGNRVDCSFDSRQQNVIYLVDRCIAHTDGLVAALVSGRQGKLLRCR